MIVTKIERQKKDPDRYSLFIDGSFAVGVRSAVLLRAGLRKGDDVSQETLGLLRTEEELGGASAAALRYAGRRRRTEHEIRKKLTSLSFSPAAIEAAMAALRVAGLADDRAFVRAFIHDAQLHRPAGGRMISHRLRSRGIPPDLLREEVASALGPGEEALLAERCAGFYLGKLEHRASSGRVFRQGEREALLRRYLAGRGFCRSAVDAALKTALPSAERGG